MPQVVTISPSGELSGLQMKPGKGLDLTRLGEADVERISEILWHKAEQKWFVHILLGAKAGPLTVAKWEAADLGVGALHAIDPDYAVETDEAKDYQDRLLIFTDYDRAVQAEIKYLDTVRLTGELGLDPARQTESRS